MEPAQWLADYRDRIERVAYNARAASASLREVGASVTSPRGEVTVTVNAGGGLEQVRLTPAARKLETDALGALITATSREAQRLASARVAEVMAVYLGEGDALAQITQHQPAEVVR
ncbi:YbaB/EbfC family nucleoid-associated protein [Actinophytocola sp.]|uniref:YbaB/EbfC family nucleoid-associated protein n=1 Tax=Actinophytocola sp. TaxID=1872138 RepID=UPI002ED0F849